MQTKLVNEVQLPTTIQPLGRETILLGEGEGKGVHARGVTDGSTPAPHPAHQNGTSVTPPADKERHTVPKAVLENQDPDPVRGGAVEGKKSFKNPFKGFAQKEGNPFKSFAQPNQPGAEQPSTSLVNQVCIACLCFAMISSVPLHGNNVHILGTSRIEKLSTSIMNFMDSEKTALCGLLLPSRDTSAL